MEHVTFISQQLFLRKTVPFSKDRLKVPQDHIMLGTSVPLISNRRINSGEAFEPRNFAWVTAWVTFGESRS